MSEEYFYNRSRNIQGVSDINLTTIAPSYGMTVKFNAENKTMDFTDGYFKKTPYGLNSLKAVFNCSYEANHNTIQKIANKLESLNDKVGFTNSTYRVLGQNKIYKNLPGFVDEYSINHKNKNRYELSTSLSVEESPNLLNWKTSSFLNADVKTWQEGVEFEKDDIVYLTTNTSATTSFRLGNIFYCKKDHKSSLVNQPDSGRNFKSFWTQDFEWQPDEKFDTSLAFESEEFVNKFKTRRKEENAGNLDVKNLFSSISDKQALAMLHFLETKAGYRRFRYRIPSVYNRPKVLISESWEHKWNYDNNHTITFDFIEDKLGVIPREKEDNYYVQNSFYKKKFDVDYLPNSERFGFYDGSRNWYDYYAFFSDFDDQSSNPDNFYVPPITDPIFDPGGINSGVFDVDTKVYDGGIVQDTISTDIPDSWKNNQVGAFANIDELSIGTSCTSIGTYSFFKSNIDQQLFIPPTVTGIGKLAFRECNGITGDLFIPPSVVEIGEQSFYKAYGLTDGNIFISDDSLKEPVTTIGSLAFYQLGNFVGNLIIGAGVKTIGNRAFERVGRNIAETAGRLEVGSCTETIGDGSFTLSKFTGPLIIEDSVISIGNTAFGSCEYFDSLYLGSSLEYIEYRAFYNNFRMRGDLIIPPSVIEIGYETFEGGGYDNDIVINTESLQSIDYSAFKNLSNLKSGDISFGSQCDYIGVQAFFGMSNWDALLTLPTSPNYTRVETSSFQNIASFTSNLEIPSNVKVIGQSAFAAMGGKQDNLAGLLTFNEGLETVETSAFNSASFVGNLILPDSLTSIGSSAFRDMEIDGYLRLPPNITEIPFSCFQQCSNMIGKIDIPYGVTTIKQTAFDLCESIQDLSIPDTVTVIENAAFRNCYKLKTDLYIPDGVTLIDISVFENCYNIRSVRFGPNVTEIKNNAFRGCVEIKGKIDIPDTVQEIGQLAFLNCSSFSTLDMGSGVVTIQNQAFLGCTSLAGKVTFGNSLDALVNRVFENCSNLDYVDFGNSITSIGAYCFTDCRRLKGSYVGTLVIPDSVTFISNGAFQRTGINYVQMSSNVTSLANYTFRGCVNLLSMWDLTGVTNFGGGVIDGCTRLSGELYLPDTVTTFGAINLRGNNITSVRFSPNITVIPIHAFAYFGTSNVEFIRDIGTNIISVGSWAFSCPKVADVYFPVTANPSIPFNACTNLGIDLPPDGSGYRARFHVPVGATGYGSLILPSYVELRYDL